LAVLHFNLEVAVMTNLMTVLLYLAAQTNLHYTGETAPWVVQNDGAGDYIAQWTAPFPQPSAATCQSNAAIAAAWAQSQIPVTPGGVAYSGSVAAGTWIEVPGETKTFAVRATDAGDLMAVPAAESPHKTPAQIAALFHAETNAVPTLGVMMQRAGVSIPEARWYMTNTVTDSAMTTAQRNLSEKISRTVTRWQMLRAWREARQ